MNPENNRKRGTYLGYSGVLLLAIHFFVVCYDSLGLQGSLAAIMDRLHGMLLNIPLFADDSSAKTIVLLITVVAAYLSIPPSRQKVGYVLPLILSLAGVFLYFSTADLLPVGSYGLVANYYLGLTTAGYIITVVAIGQLISATRYVFAEKYFEPESRITTRWPLAGRSF